MYIYKRVQKAWGADAPHAFNYVWSIDRYE